MSDRKEDSTTSAHDEKTVSQQQDEALEQMEKEMGINNKPSHTPDRAAAPGEVDRARASRSRDAESEVDRRKAGGAAAALRRSPAARPVSSPRTGSR